MQRIGEATARVFKSLAGLDKDAPVSKYVFALYGFLFLVAMTLLLLWIAGPSA